MSKIAVVVDSTSVIDKELFEDNSNLYSIPLHIMIGSESYKDGIDLIPSEFFEKMEQSPELPTTSQPSVGEVFNLFEELIEKYEHIIYITISSKISGTFQTGVLVKNQVSEKKITVFDSSFTSVIQKQMAIEALELIKKDKSIEDIIKNLEYIRSNSSILLVVDELNHLHRTGRIGLAAASFGTMLKVKPVLSFDQGEILVKKKIRTIKKAHNNLIELITKEKLCKDSKIMIAHANGYDYALKLKEKALKIYPNHEIIIDELSPVISVHTGPNTVGISWINKMK